MVSRKSPARIKSINERVSGVVFFGRTRDGTAVACDEVTLKRLEDIPPPYRKTLTQDRGTEKYGYKKLQKAQGMAC